MDQVEVRRLRDAQSGEDALLVRRGLGTLQHSPIGAPELTQLHPFQPGS